MKTFINTKLLLGILVATLGFMLFACKKDKKEDTNTKPSSKNIGCDTIEIFRDINSPTLWKEGKVYVIRSWIDINATLDIEPGTIIKFENNKCGMEIYAKVTAEGTKTKPIIFTSFKDDSYCGDNNGDNKASKPAKGDWGRITMRGAQHGSSFIYCKFLYGGGDGNGVIYINPGVGDLHDFTFDHCTFAHTSAKNGTINSNAAFSGAAMKDDNVSVLRDNYFFDNTKPIFISTQYSLNTSNQFNNPDKATETNQYNGIFLLVEPLNGKTVGLSSLNAPYVIDDTLALSGSDVLVVGHKVTVKFTKNSMITAQNNNQFAADASASFTSYKDDSRGGDTNGDTGASTPAKGDWEGIKIDDTCYSTNVFYSNQ
ncbi:MAG: hypothetical protein M0R38_05605 [Bacteroidia bacterium]|nr:hypothetical protein [Bacteroidia bacterium]